MKTFHGAVTAHYEVASQRFHLTLLRSPALLLFSKTDPVGNEESNKKVQKSWEKLGLKVGFCAKCTVCCWLQGLCDLLFTCYRGSTLEEKQTVKFTAVCHLLQWCRICGTLPSRLHIPAWPCLLILSVLPDVREVLGPVSTCRPLPHVPEGVSGWAICLSGWTGACYIPREDWSETLSLIIYVVLMHRYILAALSWQKCCSLSEQREGEMLLNIFNQ